MSKSNAKEKVLIAAQARLERQIAIRNLRRRQLEAAQEDVYAAEAAVVELERVD